MSIKLGMLCVLRLLVQDDNDGKPNKEAINLAL
jgi:hypothetical protein